MRQEISRIHHSILEQVKEELQIQDDFYYLKKSHEYI